MAVTPEQVQIGNYTRVRIKTAEGTPDSLEIGTGASGVRYVEDTPGGTILRVAHVVAATASAPTSVAVAGDDITVTLGTGATAGTATATAAQVVTAVNNHAGASALVTASAVGDGTGTAVAAALTALSGGSDLPVYTDLYGERDNERSDEREAIDASHKGSKHNITIPGRRSGELSMTLVATRADVTAAEEPSQAALEDIYEAGTAITFRHVRSYPGAPADGSGDKVREASGVLLSLSESASDNEVVTYDATLTLNEALTPVA